MRLEIAVYVCCWRSNIFWYLSIVMLMRLEVAVYVCCLARCVSGNSVANILFSNSRFSIVINSLFARPWQQLQFIRVEGDNLSLPTSSSLTVQCLQHLQMLSLGRIGRHCQTITALCFAQAFAATDCTSCWPSVCLPSCASLIQGFTYRFYGTT